MFKTMQIAGDRDPRPPGVPSRTRLRLEFGWSLVIAVSLGAAGCSKSAAIPASLPVAVSASAPVEQSVTEYAEFTGRTAAVESVEVRARLPGFLATVKFKEGSMVQRGDVLFVIDPRPYTAELVRSRAQLAQSKANLGQAFAQVTQAETQVKKAAANAQFQEQRFERSRQLLSKNTISREDFEQRESESKQAQADLENAKAQVGLYQTAIETARTLVEVSEAAVGVAELNLRYTDVVAPVSGRVSRMLVTAGNFVQSGEQGGGTLLTTLVSVDPIYANFDVDERNVQRARKLVRDGLMQSAREQQVSIWLGLGTENGFQHQGTIDFIDNQVSAKTGTLRVRGVFPNADDVLIPGYFVRVRVPMGHAHPALLVTDRAIDNDQGQKIVYVVNEKNEIDTRPVLPGALFDGLRIIEDGLKPGERVVVSGLQRVRPGMKVKVEQVEMPRSSTLGSKPDEINDSMSTKRR